MSDSSIAITARPDDRRRRRRRRRRTAGGPASPLPEPRVGTADAAAMLTGHVIVETGVGPREAAVRAALKLSAADGREWLHVGRPRTFAAYDLADLDGVHGAAADGRAALRFARPPGSQVIVQSDDAASLVAFLRAVRAAAGRQGARLDRGYGPRLDGYVSVGRCDRLPAADGPPNALVLVNVDATALTGQIGRLPVSYVDLSRSKLDTGARSANWDWMSSDTIGATLTVLVINSVGLETVPFEIVFLRNLRTLSLASNKLTHLPHFLGELEKLDCLFIDDNMLTYLPICLKDKTFKHLNISKNQLEKFVVELHENKDKKYLKTKRSSKNKVSDNLFCLSLCSIIDNNIKFKRQHLFRSMYHYFDIVYRCPDCNRLMVPDYSTQYYEFGYASTINLIQSTVIAWQSFECSHSKCCGSINYFQNLWK